MPTTGTGLSTTTLQYDALSRAPRTLLPGQGRRFAFGVAHAVAPQSITWTLLNGGRNRTATAVFPGSR